MNMLVTALVRLGILRSFYLLRQDVSRVWAGARTGSRSRRRPLRAEPSPSRTETARRVRVGSDFAILARISQGARGRRSAAVSSTGAGAQARARLLDQPR